MLIHQVVNTSTFISASSGWYVLSLQPGRPTRSVAMRRRLAHIAAASSQVRVRLPETPVLASNGNQTRAQELVAASADLAAGGLQVTETVVVAREGGKDFQVG